MSHHERNQTWQRKFASRHLPGLQFRVGLCISTYVNSKSGLAWPSQDTIAEVTKISAKNVSPAIKRLVAKGWLSREKRPGGGTNYRLEFPREGIQLNRVDPLQLDAKTQDKDADQSEVVGIQPDKGALSSQTGEPYPAGGVTTDDNRMTEEGGASSATPSPSVFVVSKGEQPASNDDLIIELDPASYRVVHHDLQADEVDHDPVITDSTQMVTDHDRAGRPKAASYPEFLDYLDVFTDLDFGSNRDRLKVLIDLTSIAVVAERLRRNPFGRRPQTSIATWLDMQPELDVSDMPDEEDETDAA